MIRRLFAGRRGLIVAVVAVGLFLAGGVLAASLRTDEARDTATVLAGDLAAVCASDAGAAARAGADCAQAQRVARDGIDGVKGDKGDPGRGILGTSLRDGRLVVAYDDGTTTDVGAVVGPGGREIAATAIEGGRLVVTLTDGQRLDLGAVVGPSGRGIASLDGTSGRLLVTLTDGTVVDAGPLPRARDGADGQDAPSVERQTFHRPDGSTRVCDRSGGTDSAPEFRCTDTPAPGDPGGGSGT